MKSKSNKFLRYNIHFKQKYIKTMQKSKHSPMYIDKHCNHPSNTFKHVPISINKRIQTTPVNLKKTKKYTVPPEEIAGILNKMQYINKNRLQKKEINRKNIIWFNPI